MVPGQQNILALRTAPNGKKRWVRVGTAFPLRNGAGFNLCLDAIPTDPFWDGTLVMKPELQRSVTPTLPQGGQSDEPPPFPVDDAPYFPDEDTP